MDSDKKVNRPHQGQRTPSPWVTRYGALIPEGDVLDLACGAGRHGRYLMDQGYRVTFLDRDVSKLADLRGNSGAEILQYDLECGNPWPFVEGQFSGIVVVNYLHRDLFRHLLRSLQVGGVLLYQTFAQGNEKYGKPSNPDFLLREDELLKVFGSDLQLVDFEQGFQPNPDRVIQSICGIKMA